MTDPAEIWSAEPETLPSGDGPAIAPARLAPGARVGRYLLAAELGAGATGVVYAADDLRLGRRIALKLLAAPLHAARALAEARAIARVRHANVITVHDVGMAGDRAYIAMELVHGDTLRVWETTPGLRLVDVLAAYLHAGDGLAAAHRAGIVHRDCKPDNVLIGYDGSVRVVDFGIARMLEHGPTGPSAGTARYMSPEQHRGDDVGPASDQFSFCVALATAVSGCHPFEGDPAQLRERVLAGAIDPRTLDGLAAIGPAGAPLRRLILRGLAPEPRERHATLVELLEPLRRIRDQLGARDQLRRCHGRLQRSRARGGRAAAVPR